MPGVVAFVWVMAAVSGVNHHNQANHFNEWRPACHTLLGGESKDPNCVGPHGN